jgi:hypothetical protein
VSPHTSKKADDYPRSKFGEKFIDKKKCAPRTLDLNQCDFFYRVIHYQEIWIIKANIVRGIKNIRPT